MFAEKMLLRILSTQSCRGDVLKQATTTALMNHGSSSSGAASSRDTTASETRHVIAAESPSESTFGQMSGLGCVVTCSDLRNVYSGSRQVPILEVFNDVTKTNDHYLLLPPTRSASSNCHALGEQLVSAEDLKRPPSFHLLPVIVNEVRANVPISPQVPNWSGVP